MVAIDGADHSAKTVTVAQKLPGLARDLRLAAALPHRTPDNSGPLVFAEQRQVVVAARGTEWRQDSSGGQYRIYDTLEKIFHLVCTLLPQAAAQLNEFRFLIKWPRLPPDERDRLYSKHACHELNVFLYLRDRPFFESVVRPHLQCKLRKSVVDCALLGLPLSQFADAALLDELNSFELLLVGASDDAALSGEDVASIIKDRVRGDRVDSSFGSSLPHLFPPPPTPKPSDPQAGKVDQNHINRLFDAALLADLPDGEQPAAEAVGDEDMEDGEEDEAGEGQQMGDELELQSAMMSAQDMMLDSVEAFGGGGPPMAMAARAAPMAMAAMAPPPPPGMARMARAVPMGFAAAPQMMFAADAKNRKKMKAVQLYRPPDKTKEFAERGYFDRDQDLPSRGVVPANRFWEDCARQSPGSGLQSVLSARWFEACGSVSEALLMMAILDVPFSNTTQAEFPAGGGMVLRPVEPAIIFVRQIRAADGLDAASPLLVHQNFFEYDSRQTTDENGQLVDKYIRDEWVAGWGGGVDARCCDSFSISPSPPSPLPADSSPTASMVAAW